MIRVENGFPVLHVLRVDEAKGTADVQWYDPSIGNRWGVCRGYPLASLQSDGGIDEIRDAAKRTRKRSKS